MLAMGSLIVRSVNSNALSFKTRRIILANHYLVRYMSSQDQYPPSSGSAGSADTGKDQPPLLPGLSPDQIRKIGEMDK